MFLEKGGCLTCSWAASFLWYMVVYKIFLANQTLNFIQYSTIIFKNIEIKRLSAQLSDSLFWGDSDVSYSNRA